jgi:hypothetical protein
MPHQSNTFFEGHLKMNSAFSVCVLIVFKILTAVLLLKKIQYIKFLLAYMHLRINLQSFQQPFLEALWIVFPAASGRCTEHEKIDQ